MQFTLNFPGGDVDYYMNASASQLLQMAPPHTCVLITDRNVNQYYGETFSRYRVLTVKAGERAKTWETLQTLSAKLAELEVHRNTMLIGIGGGVVTDITGLLASIYMRGVAFGFVPSSLLGMVDAAVGGKNGINVGLHKNMLGTINQPRFILYDTDMLRTLPDPEWSNGFAEIIKYGCIGNVDILHALQVNDIRFYKQKPSELNALITTCVQQKNTVVLADEKETGLRKILNFGHTAGHALETLYELHHGYAVALGMMVALIASEQILQLSPDVREMVAAILQRYNLPVKFQFDVDQVMHTLRLDKKRHDDNIDFILLEAPGQAVIRPLSFDQIRVALQTFADVAKY
jgi:3-dehydroquinate synthase